MGAKAALALLVDLLAGDPPMLHPVRLLGAVIAGFERLLRPRSPTAQGERVGGVVLAGVVVGGAYLGSWGLLRGVSRWPLVRESLEVWLLAMTIAMRGLVQAAGRVRQALEQGDLGMARAAVGEMVGRKTDDLDEREVIRAAVESVAESVADGITAPLFYGFIGGAPLAMAYRAANTLDSMVGYRSPRYVNFGWASAKLDDLATCIPARLTAVIFPLGVALVGEDSRGAIATMLRDGRKHPSPNAGLAEAAMAGALGVRLGGTNIYGSRVEVRPHLGDSRQPLTPHHITQAVRIAVLTAGIFAVAGAVLRRR